ncbi:MFS transporter [Bifidobacterium psychraerophilum]|uniref:MFS transporter n=1 Tax=Bifidobacterium psychraerophilum TaxID=218140 RepID=UPI0023F098D1|nr:MFS transporter [Bifidobacterium psychraerophilum]MCI1804821.1 MFS transporter [Bifidobacterium psychraerophilum]
MTVARNTTWRPWLVFIGCCILSYVGFGLIVNTPGLYFTTLCAQLNVSRAEIAFATSIMAITGALTMLVAGRIMKLVDSRVLISVCIAAVGALFFAQSLFTQLWQFYVSFGLMGIFYVIPIALAPSVLLSNWFEDKLGTVMGIALGLSGIGGTVFNPIVSSFITNLGWRTSYRLTALILVACILPFSMLVFKFRPDMAKGEQAFGHTISTGTAAVSNDDLPGLEAKVAYKTPSFILLVIVSVLLQIVAGLVQHVSGYEVSRGLSLEQGAVVVSGIMFGAAIGKATIGILLDRVPTKLVIAGYGILGIAGWGLMSVTNVVTPATIAGVLAGTGQGVVLVALPWLIRKAFGQRDYSEILSIVSMFGAIASAVSVTLHGYIYDATGSYVPSLLGNVALYVVAIIAAIVAFTMRPTITTAAAHTKEQ